jgi:hypothetical protein
LEELVERSGRQVLRPQQQHKLRAAVPSRGGRPLIRTKL